MKQLLESPDPRHKLLGKTLDLYLKQDEKVYNFDLMESLYLINYKDGHKKMNIIGGTSPSTFFFTSANQIQCSDIMLGARSIFSENVPLYQRDFTFQKYLYGIQKFMPEFKSRFKELDQYLDTNFSKLSLDQLREINNITADDFNNNYAFLDTGSEGHNVKVLSFTLKKKSYNPLDIETSSDFTIQTTKNKKVNGVRPLVLPVEKINESLIYTTDKWDSKTQAPYLDEKPLEFRKLPFVANKYPYLTIGDFLESYLIRTPYPINKEKFFNGNFTSNTADQSSGFLLPLKKTFFDYFSIEDLLGQTKDGKNLFELKQVGNDGVQAILRIPIANKSNNCPYITYSRIYYAPQSENVIETPDVAHNKGVILENMFTVAIFPFFKLEDKNIPNHYRIGLISRDLAPTLKSNKYALSFYEDTENAAPIKTTAEKTRSDKSHLNQSSEYYVLEKRFDYLSLANNWTQGIIIPLLPMIKQGGTKKFTFAVDFGTTNTHIEYTINGNKNPKPLTMGEKDPQLGTLHNPEDKITINTFNRIRGHILTDIILEEFSPYKISEENEFLFPQRTAILSHKSLDITKSTFAMADLNIAFRYEKADIRSNQDTTTNLKWGKQDQYYLVKAYFENILLYIRNKVLLNDGDLKLTELIWFYPASMMANRKNKLERLWLELFNKYINPNKPKSILESVAPFYFYKAKEEVTASKRPSVSIDIGGGTSDIVIYKDDKPQCVTSFRFAANSVFGDGFNGSPDNNGFVNKYYQEIMNLLDQNSLQDLMSILQRLRDEKGSEDICTFFFSLENNFEVKQENAPISFTHFLLDADDFKIVFLLFYGSIIYHVAKLMKAKEMEIPRYITFSGTGSKIITLLDTSQDLKTLGKFTSILFANIFESEEQKVQLKQNKNPKQITCKGGLLADKNSEDTEGMKVVLLGTPDNVFADKATYNTLNEKIEKDAEKEFQNFLELFFHLDKQINFNNNFGVNPSQRDWYKDLLLEEAIEFIKMGIKTKQSELEEDDYSAIEETLFFYPLVGGLKKLANNISKEL
ncbi:MAG: hypothetical protein LUG51_09925 [Tannerellaceae bacterium]|nr:hypothetical protein [Tannerellaceae bacterium]